MPQSSHPMQAADADLRRRENKLHDIGLFARKFLVKGTQIASVHPSSRAISEAMTHGVDFSQPGVIVELGGGTGAITRSIISRLQPHHRFIIVELDPDFIEILRERFPQYEVIRADATRLDVTLGQMGVRQVRHVFSGLATPHLPLRGQIRMHRWLTRMLHPAGAFMQVTYVPRLYLGYYRRLFHEVRYQPIWRNVPPGGVYACRNIRPFIIPKRARRAATA